ncbi:hypothetical protein MPDQ_006713 [Monascus purpureus]|uniref:Uncharacterized protein n=1 Tax=Monascus purpureus TaxID=5098 RepID=A0A507QTV0_MONPU|nr:hypothetical protein MPDQ_006713 [Monascus purpureus]BDD62289.1 hypothetical protein MAP00_007263 [Monascus purpureus]
MGLKLPRIFITGATGYIGGDVFYALIQKYPHLEASSSCLVRSEAGVKLLQSAYPGARPVLGDLGNAELLESAAAEADIVLHCASIEDVESSQALARGLARRRREGPAYWICTSGTDNLGWETIKNNSYGETYPKIYDDYDGVIDVLSLPDQAPHRDVEKVQQDAASDRVKVAIVSPPCIYGVGRGCGNKRSIQLPDLAKYTIQHGKAFQVGRGLSHWPNLHINDLGNLFVLLVEEALKGGGNATWGLEGYYFAANEKEHVWGDIAVLVAKEAQSRGLTSSVDVLSWSAEEADKHMEFCNLFYGTDCRCRAVRARKLLGWQPTRHSIEEEISATLAEEARRLQGI